jgi:hypothetical protein
VGSDSDKHMDIFVFQNQHNPKAKYGPSGEVSFPYPTAIAYEKENILYAIGPGTPILFKKGGSMDEWLKSTFGAVDTTKRQSIPGTYFKRIWKPGLANYAFAENLATKETFQQSSVSLRILLRKLNELFEIIEPHPSNLATYGHKIREILLLACMEVESSWAAVLREQDYNLVKEKSWGTNDYIRLLNPMLLRYYAISLRAYPSVAAFKPFENWNDAEPTSSLSWYDAYNQTKHNREQNLDKATLQNTIEAVMAAVIMHRAQFGTRFKRHWMLEGGIDDEIREMFDLDTREVHQQIAEFYVPDIIISVNDKGEEIASVSQDWKPTKYQFT